MLCNKKKSDRVGRSGKCMRLILLKGTVWCVMPVLHHVRELEGGMCGTEKRGECYTVLKCEVYSGEVG